MTTIGTLFTGFGGMDVGAMAAGVTPLWGIEYRADVAAVANANLGGHVQVADVLTCNPADFAPVDVLHASPPCPNFSVANANRGETANDLALAAKVAEFVTTLRPRVFTLENVMAYRDSRSWRNIENQLFDAGYWVSVETVNAADFGVPQTRKRMIVRAVLGGFVPYLPEPVPWVGWYAAIADLIDGLPDSKLAPWQLERMPAELQTLLVSGVLNSRSTELTQLDAAKPASTVTTSHNQSDMRAVLVDGDNPAMTVQSWHGRQPSHYPQAVLTGRVVAMTPRCLARFQSFPDSYELPAKRTLAAYGIGNAVSPLMYQAIIGGMI
jgi:DNA (cytosine-5)-methyltransferase 1